MPNCWKFFAGLIAGLLAALLLNLAAFALNLGVPTDLSHWTFEMVEKKKMLAKATVPPRLLIVGGSASLFGVIAREIEKQTGYPTLNLATHAALGPAYILNTVKTEARPGDTVLLVMEYELYKANQRSDVWLDYLVARDPHYFHGLSLLEQWNTFMLTPQQRIVKGLKARFRSRRHVESPFPVGPYNPDYIDSWGDQSHHPRSTAPSTLEIRNFQHGFPLPEHPLGFAIIESFCHWAQKNQIRVFATYPNVFDGPEMHTPIAATSLGRIAKFYTELGVPIVGAYTDALLPRDQFFDTVYHLTEEAALTRTDRLAEKLKPFLSETNGTVRAH